MRPFTAKRARNYKKKTEDDEMDIGESKQNKRVINKQNKAKRTNKLNPTKKAKTNKPKEKQNSERSNKETK